MIIRLTSPDDQPLSHTDAVLLPEPASEGGELFFKTDAEGSARIDGVIPKVFMVEAKAQDGTTLSSRAIARPDSITSQELIIRLHRP